MLWRWGCDLKKRLGFVDAYLKLARVSGLELVSVLDSILRTFLHFGGVSRPVCMKQAHG